MRFDMSAVPEQALAHFKDGEGTFFARIADTDDLRVIEGRLPAGASIGMHCHETDCEIISVKQGCGKVLTADGEERLSPGDCHYCPRGASHSLVNDSEKDLCFFAAIPK